VPIQKWLFRPIFALRLDFDPLLAVTRRNKSVIPAMSRQTGRDAQGSEVGATIICDAGSGAMQPYTGLKNEFNLLIH
jgi:hypothetical protein